MFPKSIPVPPPVCSTPPAQRLWPRLHPCDRMLSLLLLDLEVGGGEGQAVCHTPAPCGLLWAAAAFTSMGGSPAPPATALSDFGSKHLLFPLDTHNGQQPCTLTSLIGFLKAAHTSVSALLTVPLHVSSEAGPMFSARTAPPHAPSASPPHTSPGPLTGGRRVGVAHTPTPPWTLSSCAQFSGG